MRRRSTHALIALASVLTASSAAAAPVSSLHSLGVGVAVVPDWGWFGQGIVPRPGPSPTFAYDLELGGEHVRFQSGLSSTPLLEGALSYDQSLSQVLVLSLGATFGPPEFAGGVFASGGIGMPGVGVRVAASVPRPSGRRPQFGAELRSTVHPIGYTAIEMALMFRVAWHRLPQREPVRE